jgi:hypothetical protein
MKKEICERYTTQGEHTFCSRSLKVRECLAYLGVGTGIFVLVLI